MLTKPNSIKYDEQSVSYQNAIHMAGASQYLLHWAHGEISSPEFRIKPYNH